MKKIFLIFFLISSNIFLYGIELVKDNSAAACIIIPKNAPPPVCMAASEISAYAQKITGSALKTVDNSEKNLYSIRLEVKNLPDLGPDGYKIAGDKNSLLISGNTPRAVLYGTYAFIEKFFGVRWFAPGELYEHCPSNKKLVIPDSINISSKPEFTIRNVAFIGCNWNSDLRESWKFLARSRFQVRGNIRNKKFLKDYDSYGAVYSGGGHTLAKLIPDTLFETHPEYFALVKGRRIKQISEKGQAQSQPCTSNPEVTALAIKGITEYFDNAPAGSSYLIGNNDVPVWCECDSCIALDSPSEREKGYVSTRFFKFVNEVVKGVRKKHPAADIRAWGYQNYRFAPDGVKPDPSLRINLCDHQRCYRHSMDDNGCQQNDIFRNMFKSWRDYGLPVSERGYQEVLLRDGYFYLPIENVIAGDLRYFKKNGVDGYIFTVNPPDGKYSSRYGTKNIEYRKNAMYCLWPAIYICGKMLWDTTLSPQEIWEDAGKHFYGTAWKTMKEYRNLLQNTYTKTSGHIIYSNPQIDIGKCLQKPGVKQKLLSLLEKAEKTAASDPDKKVAARIALEKKYFIEAWLKNADAFEKQLPRASSAVKTAEKITVDGIMQEQDWQKTQFIAGFPQKVEPPSQPSDIFTKVLYDKDFIYISLVGTNPTDGEKWLLTLLDHGNLNLPSKIFDLDKKTPFIKACRKYDGKICYELKISRQFINLAPEAAALFVNVSRVQFNNVCGKLFKSSVGSVTFGQEAIRNGSFIREKTTSPDRKKINSATFPANWGFSGRNSNFQNGKLHLSGTLYQYMAVNGGKKGGQLNIDIIASPSGNKTGTLRPYLSLQKSAGKGKFKHELKKYSRSTSVSSKAIYHFTFELAPNEKGYFYIIGKDIIIENIAAAFRQ